MKSGESKLLEEVIWGVQHDAFEDRLGSRLLRAWKLGAADETVVELIRDQIHPLKMKEAFGTLTPFRKPRLATGELVLGFDDERRPIRVPLQWLNAGLLIIGNTGSGKSTLITTVVPQLPLHRCNFWLTDLYKTQMRDLLAVMNHLGRSLIVLRASDWKMNLLDAGERDPRIHLSFVTDLLARILDLPARAQSICNQASHELYQKFGIWTGKKREFPCLFDLYESVLQRRDLNASAREAILDRLGSLLVSLTPRCAAYRRGWQAQDLAAHSIVFEMRGASEPVKQVLLESTLFGLFHDEVERGALNRRMNLFVIFDDAQRFFGGQASANVSGLTPMDELAGLIRGSGKGLGVTAQTTQGLSRRLIPNLASKIMGRCGSQEDYAMGGDLNMNNVQIEWAKRHFSPGMFVGHLAEGEWHEPFLFRVPRLNTFHKASDHEVATSIRPLKMIPVIHATEFAKWQPRRGHDANLTSDKSILSEVDLRFLQAVIRNPGKPSSFYAGVARMSGKRAGDLRQRLMAEGYLREHALATGQRGRTAIVIEPLEPAIVAVAKAEESGTI